MMTSEESNEVVSTTETTGETKFAQAPTEWEVFAVSAPNSSEISNRLDKALKVARRVNRSAELVPLTTDYDMMRIQLKALTCSAKKYRDAMIQLDKARMDVSCQAVPVKKQNSK